MLAADEVEARALTAEVVRLQAAGTRVRSVDGAELGELEPALAGAAAVALEIDAAQVNPMRSTLSLVQAAMSSGTDVRHATSVTSLSGSPGGWDVGTTSGMIRAQSVVLAAGVWSRELAALVGVDLPVWPRKGHILVTEPAPNLVRHILFEYG